MKLQRENPLLFPKPIKIKKVAIGKALPLHLFSSDEWQAVLKLKSECFAFLRTIPTFRKESRTQCVIIKLERTGLKAKTRFWRGGHPWQCGAHRGMPWERNPKIRAGTQKLVHAPICVQKNPSSPALAHSCCSSSSRRKQNCTAVSYCVPYCSSATTSWTETTPSFFGIKDGSGK